VRVYAYVIQKNPRWVWGQACSDRKSTTFTLMGVDIKEDQKQLENRGEPSNIVPWSNLMTLIALLTISYGNMELDNNIKQSRREEFGYFWSWMNRLSTTQRKNHYHILIPFGA
jgi:hypothetical protein